MSNEFFDAKVEELNIKQCALLLENSNYKKLLKMKYIDIISYDEIEKKIEQNEIEIDKIDKSRKKIFMDSCKSWITNKPSPTASVTIPVYKKNKAGKTRAKHKNVPACDKCGFQATSFGGYGSHGKACEGPLPPCACEYYSDNQSFQREHLRKCKFSTHKIKKGKSKDKGKGKAKDKSYYYYEKLPEDEYEEEIKLPSIQEEDEDIEDALSKNSEVTGVEDGDGEMNFYSSGSVFVL